MLITIYVGKASTQLHTHNVINVARIILVRHLILAKMHLEPYGAEFLPVFLHKNAAVWELHAKVRSVVLDIVMYW